MVLHAWSNDAIHPQWVWTDRKHSQVSVLSHRVHPGSTHTHTHVRALVFVRVCVYVWRQFYKNE